jgi:hypothetical protein
MAARKKSRNTKARDSRTGQKKMNLTTKRGAAVSGASKPSKARKAQKPGASGGRKPRASAGATARKPGAKQSTVGRRPPRPVSAAGRSAAKKK